MNEFDDQFDFFLHLSTIHEQFNEQRYENFDSDLEEIISDEDSDASDEGGEIIDDREAFFEETRIIGIIIIFMLYYYLYQYFKVQNWK